MKFFCELEKIVMEISLHMKRTFQRLTDDIIATVLKWNTPNCRGEKLFREFRCSQRSDRMGDRRCYRCGHYGHISQRCFKQSRTQWRATNDVNERIVFFEDESENFCSNVTETFRKNRQMIAKQSTRLCVLSPVKMLEKN